MHFWNLKVSIYLSTYNLVAVEYMHEGIVPSLNHQLCRIHVNIVAPQMLSSWSLRWCLVRMKVCEPPVLLILLVIGLSLDTVDSGEAERRLLNTLMEQYNKLERPVYNESDPLVLTFGLTLQQIIDVVSFIFLIIPITLWILLLGAVRSTSFNYWWKQ